jgi:ATP-binding cassette subfamily B protein
MSSNPLAPGGLQKLWLARRGQSNRNKRVGIGRVFREFIPALLQYRGALVLSLVFSLLAVAATVLMPWPLKYIIDSVLVDHPLPGWMGGLVGDMAAGTLVLLFGAAGAAITSAGALCAATEKKINARMREQMTLDLRERVLRHIQVLPITHRAGDRSGELSLRLVDDVHHVVRLLSKTVPITLRHLVTMLAIFVVIFGMDLRLGAAGLVLVCTLAVLTRFYVRPLGLATREKRREEGAVAGLSQEIIRALPAIQALGTEDEVRQRFIETNQRSLSSGVRETRVAVSMEQMMQIANGIVLAVIVVWGGLEVLNGKLTIGTLTVYIAYIVQILKPVEKINELASTFARGIARGETLLRLLDRVPAVTDSQHAIQLDRSPGQIELRSVHYSYPSAGDRGAQVHALRNINLTIAPGTLTVVTGPSGAGKSTLLMLLLRMLEPDAGQLLIDGIPYADIRLSSLRAQFAVMLQESHVFAGRIRDCLQPGSEGLPDAALWRVLEQVALGDFVRALPNGIDAALGESALNLSGGQRARLCLARALLMDRPFLLLDEPLANVDPESQLIILEALQRTRGKRTCVAVSHQTGIEAIADRVLRLDHDGLHEQPVRTEMHRQLQRARA